MNPPLRGSVTAARLALLESFDEHRVVLLICVCYVLVGGAVLAGLGRPRPFSVMNFWFLGNWAAASTLWLSWEYLRHPRRFWSALEPARLAGSVMMALVFVPFQATFQALKQAIGPVIGFRFDRPFATLDALLHGGDAWRLLDPLLVTAPGVWVLDVAYSLWFAVLNVTLLWLCWSGDRPLRRRALVAFTWLWIAGGTLGAAVGASAGPCYYDKVTGNDRFVPLLRQLDAQSTADGMPLKARALQAWAWNPSGDDMWAQFAGISAMPSMHVALAVFVAIVAWNTSRPLGATLWLYALLIQVGSVALGWHYAVDGYAGAVIAWVVWVLSRPGARKGRRVTSAE